MASSNSRKLLIFVTVAGLAALCAARHTAYACDLPVFRYAMSRWAASPYHVYFFHNGPDRDADIQVRKQLTRLSDDPMHRVNVVHVPVDLRNQKTVAALPMAVRKALDDGRGVKPPSHVILSPKQREIFRGDITPKAITQFVDSPARRQIVTQLLRRKAAVFVMLDGADAQANEVAALEVAVTVNGVNQGRIKLRTAPKKPPNVDKQKRIPKPAFEVGFVRVSRTDAKEKWLTRMLLAVEPDLKDQQFESQPMVFGVFARGRVLPPYIGKGITRRNLVECVAIWSSASNW